MLLQNPGHSLHSTCRQCRRSQKINQAKQPHDDLLTLTRKWKLKWFSHVIRPEGPAKAILQYRPLHTGLEDRQTKQVEGDNKEGETFLQGTVQGGRRKGRQRKKWTDNIAEWTGKSFATTEALVHGRQRWRQETALPRPKPLPMTVRGGDREELCHDPSPCPWPSEVETGKSFATTQALAHDRQRWRQGRALPRPKPLPMAVRGGDREELCHDRSPCP